VPWLHPNITNPDGQQTRQHGVHLAENKKASKKLAFYQLNYSRSVDVLNLAETVTSEQGEKALALECQILVLTIVSLIYQ
jgi:Ran GTPase-activating protein (RanGAP) involved in mRNA processing and transport